MKKYSELIAQKKKTVRSLLMLLSLLFFPAFYFGLASIWGVFVAMALALFFKARFLKIINNVENIEDKGEKSWRVFCAYFYLILENLFYFGLGPCLFMLSGLEPQSSDIDALIFNYSLFLIFIEPTYEALPPNSQWVVAASWPAFLLIPLVVFSVWKEARQLACWLVFRGAEDDEAQQKVNRLVNFSILSDILTIICITMFFVLYKTSGSYFSLFEASLVLSYSIFFAAAIASLLSIGLFFATIEAWAKRLQ